MTLSATLKTNIVADKSQFSKTMTSATSEAKSFSTKTSAAFAGVGKAFVAGLAGFSFAEALRNASEQIDDIVASASKLDIGVQQFQALSYAATRSDVEIGTLESGLKKLRQTIASAESGNKKAADSFAAIGLKASDLAKMDLGAAYTQVADAIDKLKTSTEQAGAATNIFGKQGQEQLNLLRNNVGGLVSEFASLNVGLSDEDIQKFNALDEATDKLSATLRGKLQQALVALSPAITGFANGVVGALGKLGDLQDKFSMFINDYLNASKPDAATGKYNPGFIQQYVTDPFSQNVSDSVDYLTGSGYKGAGTYSRSKTPLASGWGQDSVLSGAMTGNRQATNNAILSAADSQTTHVVVTVNADKNGLISAFATSSTAKVIIDNAIRSATATEAQATGF